MSEFSPSSSARDNQQRAPPSTALGKEFQAIFEKETGQSISVEDAEEYAKALVSLALFFSDTPPIYDK